jgi:predicted ATPase
MPAFLIVGLPGSGKTTVLDELDRRGYKTIDGDSDGELSTWIHRETGQDIGRSLPPGVIDDEPYDWSWKEKRVREIAQAATMQVIFLGGNAAGTKAYYPLFQKVYALNLDSETLNDRLNQRAEGYGYEAAQRARVLSWNDDFVDKEVEAGAVIIDSTAPVSIVTDHILKDALQA